VVVGVSVCGLGIVVGMGWGKRGGLGTYTAPHVSVEARDISSPISLSIPLSLPFILLKYEHTNSHTTSSIK